MPKKQYIIKVCTGAACQKKGAYGILCTAKKTLQAEEKFPKKDKKFKIVKMKCPNYCEIAPIMKIDNTFYGNINKYDTKGLVVHEIKTKENLEEDEENK